MSPCCDLFSLPMMGNIIQNFASLLIIGSTGGVLLVILAWLRYRMENSFRWDHDLSVEISFNRAVFSLLSLVRAGVSQCCCLDKPNERLQTTVRSRLDSMTSMTAFPRSRTRTWSDAIMARLYSANRYSSPPPAYEDPPPYQVALQIERDVEKPPLYTPLETMV